MLVYQLALPHYRQAMIDYLADAKPEIKFLIGDQQFYEGVIAGVRGPNVIDTGKNIFLLRRTIGWQRTKLSTALTAESVVLELNPRLLNSWLVVGLRKLLRKRTLFWGHVFPRAGARSRTELLRRGMRGLADGMIVYTQSERKEYLARHPDKKAYVAANAVYSKSLMVPGHASDLPFRFMVVGRLVEPKKPALAMRAFAAVRAAMPGARLTLLGEGSERRNLDELARELDLDQAVDIEGEVTDYQILKDRFAEAVALVAPGYVGLNVTQSLGFGVPVIYALGEPHAPEVEVLSDENSFAFAGDDEAALGTAMLDMWSRRAANLSRRMEISEATRHAYSAEAMGEAFIRAMEDE